MPSKLGIQRQFLNLIKNISKKKKNPTTNIILNIEKFEAFPVRSGAKQGCLPLITAFQHHTWSPN